MRDLTHPTRVGRRRRVVLGALSACLLAAVAGCGSTTSSTTTGTTAGHGTTGPGVGTTHHGVGTTHSGVGTTGATKVKGSGFLAREAPIGLRVNGHATTLEIAATDSGPQGPAGQPIAAAAYEWIKVPIVFAPIVPAPGGLRLEAYVYTGQQVGICRAGTPPFPSWCSTTLLVRHVGANAVAWLRVRAQTAPHAIAVFVCPSAKVHLTPTKRMISGGCAQINGAPITRGAQNAPSPASLAGTTKSH